ncbi:MAG: ankyrin repeat domain-containing protein [bacterium]|nr:ankyrin repeat domain-containing protein [bacterium]
MLGWSQKEKDYALYSAIDDFTPARLAKAIKSGADVNTTRGRNGAPLFKAVAMYDRKESLSAVKILLEAQADIHMLGGETEYTVLHAAIDNTRGGVPMATALVEAGADIHAVDTKGNTPLQIAIYRKAWDVASYLVDIGGHKNHTNEAGLTILARAVENDAPAALIARLFDTGVDVNAASQNISAPLLSAARKGNAEVIELLLKQPGIRPDIRDREGMSALMLATVAGRKEAVEALLAGKASPDYTSGDKLTPLSYAAAAGHQEILEMLIKAGATLEVPNQYGYSALSNAASNGNIRMVMTLLAAAQERKVELNLAPALMLAAEKGHGRVMELLIKAGADVNLPDAQTRTPLMKAAAGDHVEALDILLKAGAVPDTADVHGMTSYDHAVAGGKSKAKNFLNKFRNGTQAVEAKRAAAPADDYSFVRLNDHSLEVREGEGLTMTFNFWTQQVIFRDTERPAPVVVQNFDDMQRQEAIVEAYEKLKSLGGTPPEPRAATLHKRPAALRG